MRWTRWLAAGAACVAGMAAVVGSSLPGGAQADNAWYGSTYDRRGATEVATHVFVGQVVGEVLVCPDVSGPDDVMVEDHFDVKVERNVKGRVEGTVVVRQTTDDTFRYGRDGRLVVVRKYLFITTPQGRDGSYSLIDATLGYVRIRSPEERAELVAEIAVYLAEPTPIRTPVPAQTVDPAVEAIREAERATVLASDPTSQPCEAWVIATATAVGAELGRENRAFGPVLRPGLEPVTATPGR